MLVLCCAIGGVRVPQTIAIYSCSRGAVKEIFIVSVEEKLRICDIYARLVYAGTGFIHFFKNLLPCLAHFLGL